MSSLYGTLGGGHRKSATMKLLSKDGEVVTIDFEKTTKHSMLRTMIDSGMLKDFEKGAWKTQISSQDLFRLKDYHETGRLKFSLGADLTFYEFVDWFNAEKENLHEVRDFFCIGHFDYSFFVPFLPKEELIGKKQQIFKDTWVIMRESGKWDLIFLDIDGITIEDHDFMHKKILPGLSKHHGIKFYKATTEHTFTPKPTSVPLTEAELAEREYYENLYGGEEEGDYLFEGMTQDEIAEAKWEMRRDELREEHEREMYEADLEFERMMDEIDRCYCMAEDYGRPCRCW